MKYSYNDRVCEKDDRQHESIYCPEIDSPLAD